MNPAKKIVKTVSITINNPYFTEKATKELLGKLEEVGNDIAIIALAIATEKEREVTPEDVVEAFWKLRK
ncbi:MAG: hypothetical protein ACE5R6_02710 [Candidatus Heimdallarchaeota archaeon]